MMKSIFILSVISLAFSTIRSHQLDHHHHHQNDQEDNQIQNDFGDQPTSYFEPASLAKRFNRKLAYRQYLSYSQRALSQVVGFDNDLHRYDSREDLVNSFERNLSYLKDDLSHMRAHVDRRETELLAEQNELTVIENEQNQSKCGHQLRYLLARIQHIMTNYTTYSESKELDLLDLMDSFGAPESELMMGNAAWFGSYSQCLEAKFLMRPTGSGGETATQGHSRGRYCVASFKARSSVDEEGEETSLVKIGLCLPQSCNSISILRHGEKIELLAKLVRLNQLPHSHLKLANLYCLPDENSPLRQFSLSAKLFILTLSSWLTIVIYFSLKYEYIRMINFRSVRNPVAAAAAAKQDKLMRALAFRLSWSNLFSAPIRPQQEAKPQVDPVNTPPGDGKPPAEEQSLIAKNILESLKACQGHMLITDGLRDGKQPVAAPLVCVVNSTRIESVKTLVQYRQICKSPAESPMAETINSIMVTTSPASSQDKPAAAQVDLSVIDGIKVVSMIWLIMAHTLLFFIRNIANGREFWQLLRDARYLTVMAGIFPVDTFFTVTGVLTAYLKFQKQDSIGQAKYWLEALVHRYLRFMPMYLLVFWFTRDVSEYIGSGPLWDYSTASTSLRSVCKRESFSVPLLFQANFKPLDHHCVKPAWYLANDYQFLMVTPLFMMLIMRSVRLGYSVIGLSIVCSLIAQFMTVFYTTEMEDFGALINFKPMFATYVLKNLWQLYVLPYNRIPPYLIGLLTGHLMYTSGLRAKQQQSASNRKQTAAILKDDTTAVGFASQDSLESSASPLASASTSDNESHKGNSNNGDGSTNNILTESQTLSSLSSSSCNLSDYLCIKVWTPLVFLISIIYLPMITRLITQEGLAARIGTSALIAFMRLVWSLAIARLIYIAATRFLENEPNKRADCIIVRFLASPMWKPWSKIGLSALLIQWEVIGYLAQTQTSLPDMSMTFLLATMLACIVVTYLLATIIYLAVEYPLSQFEQLYIIPALFHK